MPQKTATTTPVVVEGTSLSATQDATQPDGKTPTAVADLAAPPRRPGTYRSGFCGTTVVNGAHITHPETLHRRCSGQNGLCSCACHQGVSVWENAEQMFADAKAGRRVTPSKHVAASGGKGTKRSVGKRKS